MNVNNYESYIDSPDWIKNKNRIINSINEKDNKQLYYTVDVTLRKHSERITNVMSFIKSTTRKE